MSKKFQQFYYSDINNNRPTGNIITNKLVSKLTIQSNFSGFTFNVKNSVGTTFSIVMDESGFFEFDLKKLSKLTYLSFNFNNIKDTITNDKNYLIIDIIYEENNNK